MKAATRGIAVMLFFATLAMLGAGSGAVPTAKAESFSPPIPDNYDDLDVYLLTVGRGDMIHALFGHTFLRVVDREHKLDMNFNWGMFDFQDPTFLPKFYLGDLNYFLEVSDFYSLVQQYRQIEHRSVVQERVNLTALQKAALLKRLRWNTEPDNLHYAYSQVRNNCATKPRDYLDEVLGGKIRAFFARRAGRTGLRPMIRDGAREFWWADIGLDTLLNSSYDRTVTNWEEMFLPAKLRQHLLTMPAIGDDGRVVPGKMLLSDTQFIVDLPEPTKKADPYAILALIGVLPMAGLWMLLAGRYPAAFTYRLLGLFAMAFGFWSALWGTQFLFQWGIALYPETKRNALLWLFWPLDVIFSIWGLKLFFTGRLLRPGSRWSVWLRRISWAHLVGLALLISLWASARVQQDVSAQLAASGTAAALFYGLVLRRGAPKEA